MRKAQSRGTTVKPARQVRTAPKEEVSDFEARNGRQLKRSRNDRSVNSENGFVSLTKLFESRKNPDNLVGTCKVENLEKLSALITEAEEANSGVAFFVFLQGKWGPNLCAAVAQERDSKFNDGSRNRNWRR